MSGAHTNFDLTQYEIKRGPVATTVRRVRYRAQRIAGAIPNPIDLLIPRHEYMELCNDQVELMGGWTGREIENAGHAGWSIVHIDDFSRNPGGRLFGHSVTMTRRRLRSLCGRDIRENRL